MPLSSMTGFARAEGALSPWSWYFEAKSVNGRGLDMRCRLPPGFDWLEAELRARAPKHFKRGNLQISLMLEREAGTAALRLNRDALSVVMAALAEVRRAGNLPPPDPAAILAIRGVLETGEGEEDESLVKARDTKILETADTLLASLAKARAAEGKAIAGVLSGVVEEVVRLAEAAHAHAEAQPEKIRERIKEQVELVLSSAAGISEDRLAQELALIAVKNDVREEIDRLRVHAQSAHELMAAGEAVGRKLDFLSQEFNREANTICSKASDVALTKIGLELKAVIDQFREQVQNIE
jgi:uncharacterized protein (TIGR00255 family)